MSTVINGVRNMTGRQALTARWLLLRVAGAGLLFATAAIHLDLYLTGYRTIQTIGPLFLFQVIAAFRLVRSCWLRPAGWSLRRERCWR